MLTNKSALLSISDIVGLQALVTFADKKINTLTIIQDSVPLATNGTKMHKHIITTVASDESESFAGIKPFDCAALSWFIVSRFVVVGAMTAPNFTAYECADKRQDKNGDGNNREVVGFYL